MNTTHFIVYESVTRVSGIKNCGRMLFQTASGISNCIRCVRVRLKVISYCNQVFQCVTDISKPRLFNVFLSLMMVIARHWSGFATMYFLWNYRPHSRKVSMCSLVKM